MVCLFLFSSSSLDAYLVFRKKRKGVDYHGLGDGVDFRRVEKGKE